MESLIIKGEELFSTRLRDEKSVHLFWLRVAVSVLEKCSRSGEVKEHDCLLTVPHNTLFSFLSAS